MYMIILFIYILQIFLLEHCKGGTENREDSDLFVLPHIQTKNSNNIKFPCNLNKTRSTEVPKSVHKLRPGDIDLIGSIGDSLTAAYGAFAKNLADVFSKDTGKSYAIGIGGIGAWDTSPTLPNIFKVFNPDLIGYSQRVQLTLDNETHFDVSTAGAKSSDMMRLAEDLIRRIKHDTRVDFEKDWKMITHLVGNNDFCLTFCTSQDPEVILKRHKNDLLEMLRILRDNLPRTIVNIIPGLHVGIVSLMKDTPSDCNVMLSLACPCFIRWDKIKGSANYSKIIREWQKLDIAVSNLPEFDLDDFAVIPHSLSLEYKLPTTAKGLIDYSYLSTDCFHFSEKGHNAFGLNLWNSLLEPFGQKNKQGLALSSIKCPTEDNPFIITRRNSQEIN